MKKLGKSRVFETYIKIFSITFLINIVFFFGTFSYSQTKSNQTKYPNVILITIDALRPDHLGCYGYDKNTSPNIDKLANLGVLFTNVTSQSHSTGPSVSSIMTSTYPKTHGVWNLAAYGYQLDSSFTTLAEILKEKGYATAAAAGSRDVLNITGFGCKSGIDQGFDTFYSENKLKTDAKALNQFAIPWLKANSDGNFFLWLHYFDTHGPYVPPESYSAKFYDKDNPIIVSLELIPDYQRVHGDITDLNYYIAQYDGAINFVDNHIGILMDELNKLSLIKNTLIIVTADHGENLGEHNIFFQHRGMYETNLCVPLIIIGPKIPSDKRIGSMVQIIDIMPTVLDVLGVSLNEVMEGSSLVPLICGEKGDIHKEIFSESVEDRIKVIKTKEWRLIYDTKDQAIELYNLENDPKELNNVVNQFPKVVKDLKQRLQKFMDSATHKKVHNNQVDDEAEQRLKSLGYIQ